MRKTGRVGKGGVWSALRPHVQWLAACLAMVALAALLQSAGWGRAGERAAWIGFGFSTPVPAPTPAPTPTGPLAGVTVAVDPGHGGYDGGARAKVSGVWEKGINLDVSLKLRDALEAMGATVILTRDGDYSLNDPDPPIRKKRQDMERRAALALDGGADVLLSIHMNEWRNDSQRGPQVFYRKDCAAGKSLALLLQDVLNEALDPPRDRAANVGDFYITSLGIPSALIECGFLSNAAEEALLLDDAYQQKLAGAIAQGVADWFALPERPVAASREDR